MLVTLTHEQICNLVEIEPAPEEESSELYRVWKKEELKYLWREVKRIENSYLQRIQNRKKYVEQSLGIRIHARVPRTVIHPPVTMARFLDEGYR